MNAVPVADIRLYIVIGILIIAIMYFAYKLNRGNKREKELMSLLEEYTVSLNRLFELAKEADSHMTDILVEDERRKKEYFQKAAELKQTSVTLNKLEEDLSKLNLSEYVQWKKQKTTSKE